MAKLLRPRFTVPNERIVRAGTWRRCLFYRVWGGRGSGCNGAERAAFGTGEFFSEMALLTGARPRQADVVALSYCRLLALRKADFDRFVTANPDAGAGPSAALRKHGMR